VSWLDQTPLDSRLDPVSFPSTPRFTTSSSASTQNPPTSTSTFQLILNLFSVFVSSKALSSVPCSQVLSLLLTLPSPVPGVRPGILTPKLLVSASLSLVGLHRVSLFLGFPLRVHTRPVPQL
jgi:hypothetical protein